MKTPFWIEIATPLKLLLEQQGRNYLFRYYTSIWNRCFKMFCCFFLIFNNTVAVSEHDSKIAMGFSIDKQFWFQRVDLGLIHTLIIFSIHNTYVRTIWIGLKLSLFFIPLLIVLLTNKSCSSVVDSYIGNVFKHLFFLVLTDIGEKIQQNSCSSTLSFSLNSLLPTKDVLNPSGSSSKYLILW